MIQSRTESAQRTRCFEPSLPWTTWNFLKDLCTPAELEALVDRWQVAGLLAEGMTYRRINALTGVSMATIGRVARCLSDGFGGYQAALRRSGGGNPGQ
jgi:TrpR-related protein YerC/YecD